MSRDLKYARIAGLLRERIERGDLAVGDRLSITRLAAEHDVSRSVVSNALRLLQEERLVEEDGMPSRLRVRAVAPAWRPALVPAPDGSAVTDRLTAIERAVSRIAQYIVPPGWEPPPGRVSVR